MCNLGGVHSVEIHTRNNFELQLPDSKSDRFAIINECMDAVVCFTPKTAPVMVGYNAPINCQQNQPTTVEILSGPIRRATFGAVRR